MNFRNLRLSKKIFIAGTLLLMPIIIVCIYNVYKVWKMDKILYELGSSFRTVTSNAGWAAGYFQSAALSDEQRAKEFLDKAQPFMLKLANSQNDPVLTEAIHNQISEVISVYNASGEKDLHKLHLLTKQLERNTVQDMKAQIDYLDTWVSRSKIEQLIGFSLCVIVGLLIVISIVSRILQPINKSVQQAYKITSGDLTEPLSESRYTDEAGRLRTTVSKMTILLQKLFSSTQVACKSLFAASEKLKETSKQIDSHSVNMASYTDEVSALMEEMSASMQNTTDNSYQCVTTSGNTLKSVKECNEAAIKSVEAMSHITDKISIINNIAFQTNILALNAAVEAARAGEQGKGFSVVAADIRKLAERSALAAKEINTVGGEGRQAATAAKDVFAKVLPQIEETVALVNEISASTAEQNVSAEQINQAIQTLSQATRTYSGLAAQTASNSQVLAEQSENLTGMIGFFKTE